MTESATDPSAILVRGVGRWRGEERLAPAPWAPEGMDAEGSTTAHLILGGRGLASDYEQSVGGRVTLTAHTVIRLDGDGGLRMSFFSDPGGPPTEMTGRVDGDALVFEGPGPGGRMRQTMRYGEGEMEVTSESLDEAEGAWRPVFEGRYERVE